MSSIVLATPIRPRRSPPSLGAPYLEIIGPDPEQCAPHDPRPFGVDGLTGPRTVA